MLNPATHSPKFNPTNNGRDIKPDTAKIHFFDLSLEQAVTFLALHTYGQIEIPKSLLVADTRTIIPFAPQARYGHFLINQLIESGLISNTSNDTSFSYDGTKLYFRHPTAFDWCVPYEYRSFLYDEIIECLEQEALPEPWSNQIQEVTLSLAIAECQEFFDECTNERNFYVSDTCKHFFTEMLGELLDKYSVAQCQFLILESAKIASDALVKRTCNSYYIIDRMLTACADFINETRKDSKEIPELKQNLRPIRSMINQIVYEAILPGRDGFKTPLSKLTR